MPREVGRQEIPEAEGVLRREVLATEQQRMSHPPRRSYLRLAGLDVSSENLSASRVVILTHGSRRAAARVRDCSDCSTAHISEGPISMAAVATQPVMLHVWYRDKLIPPLAALSSVPPDAGQRLAENNPMEPFGEGGFRCRVTIGLGSAASTSECSCTCSANSGCDKIYLEVSAISHISGQGGRDLERTRETPRPRPSSGCGGVDMGAMQGAAVGGSTGREIGDGVFDPAM